MVSMIKLFTFNPSTSRYKHVSKGKIRQSESIFCSSLYLCPDHRTCSPYLAVTVDQADNFLFTVNMHICITETILNVYMHVYIYIQLSEYINI